MRKYIAEFIGTFCLVFCGTGAIIINQEIPNSVTNVGIAAVFGLVVAAMIYALGPISGAHLNPVVSIAFWLAKNFPLREILPYSISQFTGALSASLILNVLFPHNATLGNTIPAGTAMQSFILELILTMILVMVILFVAIGNKEQGMFAGIAIGSVVLLEAMFAGPVCGASMNPFRSLAPALVSTNLKFIWIYLIAPLLGSLFGVLFWRVLYQKPIH